ncbi:hypothetical protein AgCh_009901 [Apium graveolens]
MNSHRYLCNNLKGTEIGDVMGDIWLRGQKECVEHYVSVFVRESWGKLAPLLTDQEEGMQVLFSAGGREVVEPKLAKKHSNSTKSRHLIGKIKNVVTNHFLTTSSAAA